MTIDEQVNKLNVAADHAQNMVQFLEIMAKIEELLRQKQEQKSS